MTTSFVSSCTRCSPKALRKSVKDNVAAFGGDPGNVTVFGQSGGGAKVATTLAMPSANGLRHKGIVESGAALRSADKAAATEQARRLMKAVGAADLAAFREVPAQAILAANRAQGPSGARWGPVLDGAAILAHPFDPVANPVGREWLTGMARRYGPGVR